MRRFLFFIIMLGLLAPLALMRAGQSAHNARKAQYLALEAENARLEQDYEQALRLSRRAYELAPADTDIGYSLAMLEIAFTGQFNPQALRQPIERLEGYMAADPANEHYAMALQNYYKVMGDTANFLRVYQTGYAANPNDPDWGMAYARAELYIGTDSGHTERALQIMERLERNVYPQNINNPASWSIFEAYKDLGELDKAHSQLRRIYARAPRDIDMLSRMAAAMRGIGMPDSSLAYLAKIQEIEPGYDQLPLLYLSHYNDENDMPNFLKSLNDVLHAPGLDMELKESLLEEVMKKLENGFDEEVTDTADVAQDDAAPDFDRTALLKSASEAVPDSYKIGGMYVGALFDDDRKEDALTEINRLLPITPDPRRLKLAKLALYGQIRPLKQQLQLLKELRGEDPDNLQYLGIATSSLMQKGDTASAMNVLMDVDPASLSNDSLRSVYYMTVGDFAYLGSDTALTYNSYRRALELDSTNYMAANNLAYRYSTAGDPSLLPEAERLSKISLDNAEPTSTLLDTYAWIQYQMGHYVTAAEYMKRAVEADGLLQALASITRTLDQSDYNILAMETRDYSQSAFANQPVSESTAEFYNKKLNKVIEAVQYMESQGASPSDLTGMATLLEHAADIQAKLGMTETAYWFRLMAAKFTELANNEE